MMNTSMDLEVHPLLIGWEGDFSHIVQDRTSEPRKIWALHVILRENSHFLDVRKLFLLISFVQSLVNVGSGYGDG